MVRHQAPVRGSASVPTPCPGSRPTCGTSAGSSTSSTRMPTVGPGVRAEGVIVPPLPEVGGPACLAPRGDFLPSHFGLGLRPRACRCSAPGWPCEPLGVEMGEVGIRHDPSPGPRRRTTRGRRRRAATAGRSIISRTPLAPGGVVVCAPYRPRRSSGAQSAGGCPAPCTSGQSRGNGRLLPRRLVDQVTILAPVPAGDVHELGRIHAPPDGHLRQDAVEQGRDDRVGDDPAGGDAIPGDRVREGSPAPGRAEGRLDGEGSVRRNYSSPRRPGPRSGRSRGSSPCPLPTRR